jgi:hypothetical protein
MVRWMHLDRGIQHRGPDLELGWRIITYEERCPGWPVNSPWSRRIEPRAGRLPLLTVTWNFVSHIALIMSARVGFREQLDRTWR